MPHSNFPFVKQVQRIAILASNLGFQLRRCFEGRDSGIPPEWNELSARLRSVQFEQLKTLPSLAKERLIDLARLVRLAEQTLKCRENNAFYLHDFYARFPDFNTAGDKLQEALKEAVVIEPKPDPLCWADEVQTPVPGQGEEEDADREPGEKEQAEGDAADRDQSGAGQAGQTESIPRMSVKMKDVLKAMRELRAFDFDSHTTQLAVVKRINRTHQVASYRRAFKELSEKGWKAGEAGRGRGIWLTAEGRRMAEAIRQKDAEEK